MSLNEIILAASEEPEVWAGVNPWAVGVVVLVFFLAALGMLLSFGNGREHS